jgi:Ca2+-binding RTX toxin-like protein
MVSSHATMMVVSGGTSEILEQLVARKVRTDINERGTAMNGRGDDDRFIGGAGNDVLTGGSSEDTFIFNAAFPGNCRQDP